MDGLIAVWGVPGSGKTAVSACLAKKIYDMNREEKRVAVIFTDLYVPVLPYLLPAFKKEEIRSVGNALAKPVITKTDILKCIVTVPGKKNFGILGFADGENSNTFPAFSSEKCMLFLETLFEIVDIVVVDCSSNTSDPLKEAALACCRVCFCVCNNDMKSVSWAASRKREIHILNESLREHVTLVNSSRCDVILPEKCTPVKEGGEFICLPYTGEINKRWHDGTLMTGEVRDRDFSNALLSAVTIIDRKTDTSDSAADLLNNGGASGDRALYDGDSL